MAYSASVLRRSTTDLLLGMLVEWALRVLTSEYDASVLFNPFTPWYLHRCSLRNLSMLFSRILTMHSRLASRSVFKCSGHQRRPPQPADENRIGSTWHRDSSTLGSGLG
ncbi:hypothetical protein BJ912DRAFT_988038 [Pholiota molesta]|nr:hypothetical protein BJ912DRAFT_988038 [Pholiota molesta]